MTKTRAGADLYTGALIRQALTGQGVSHRVGAGATERGWLATTGHDGPTVYITAHDCNGGMGYDVDRAAHIGFNAVVTDDQGTRMVYNGTSANLRPVPDAEACARAVAAHLGLPGAWLCSWCEDTGSITIHHPSTDGITGHRECDNPPCVARGERLVAEYEARKAREEAEAAAHVCADALCCPPF
ncbi:hypothetical protein LKL35_36985 [Streptomyces sp. ET3-23]|uniref:hypothetical protein n=1 Tax=Streptomyces sp. ET3-23 TaxID=2885643 RepID=UPI001D11C830|nr:hypothetical protein [Streptomyces sp. ET3-23]MCC2280918.1 hypothetical protein [Streptomyces sp. ET3-23]